MPGGEEEARDRLVFAGREDRPAHLERLRHAVGPRSTLAYVPGVLSSAECARLRVFTEAALTRPDGQPWRTWGDSVDQELEWQLDLQLKLREMLQQKLDGATAHCHSSEWLSSSSRGGSESSSTE